MTEALRLCQFIKFHDIIDLIALITFSSMKRKNNENQYKRNVL